MIKLPDIVHKNQPDLLYDKLKSEIEIMPAGTQFHSIRKIIKNYHVSQYSVDKALKRLEQDGLLIKTASNKRFIYSKELLTNNQLQIAMVMPKDYMLNTEFSTNFSALRQRCEEADMSLKDCLYDPAKEVTFDLPANFYPNIIIHYHASKRLTIKELSFLDQFNVPIIMLDMSFEDIAVNTVRKDHSAGGLMAAKELIKLGHRQVAVIIGEPYVSTIKTRVTAFKDYMELHNGSVELINCHTKSGEQSIEKSYRKILELGQNNTFTFTALLGISDSCAIGALRALRELRIHVPDDISVIGIDDIQQSAYMTPSLSSIGFSQQAFIDAIMEIIESSITANKKTEIKKIVIPPFAHLRESTKAPNKIDTTK